MQPKKPALSYILNNGFAIFYKSEFLKAEIAEKQQQKYAKNQQKFPPLQPTAPVSTNKNITFMMPFQISTIYSNLQELGLAY